MEPLEKFGRCSKHPEPADRDPRISCFECFAKTPCYKVLTAQYSIRKCRPKFLRIYPFKKRLRKEFALSRKALAKFLRSKGVEPIVQLPDLEEKFKSSFTVWELAKSMSEWMRYSVSSVISDKKAPIIEELIPRIKEFPLTQESVKKHIEKETVKKKEEIQETVLILKKKQQQLKKLKGELKLQSEKQYCHRDEKLADYEKEKMKYLEKLANEHNLRLKDLIRNGDLIYKNYRSEMKKLNERKMRDIEKRVEINARLLQEELKRQKQMKKHKSSLPKFITKKAKETTSESSPEEEEAKNVEVLKEPMKMKSREHLMEPSRVRFFKGGRSHKSKLSNINKSRMVISKTKLPSTPSKMGEELKDIIKQLEEVWNEIEQTWSEEKKEPQLPDNDLLIVRPTAIVFRDFLPFNDYEETVNVYNPTKEAVDCGFFKCYAVPQYEENIIFEVYPELIIRIRPGGNQDFKVIFMTELWDEVKDGIKGIVWFWSKVLRTNNFYRIPIQVECIRFTSNIKIENPIIKFNQVPSWINFGSTKYLEITNYSKIDYEVYIHRKSKINETESFWKITSDYPMETQRNIESSIQTIKAISKNTYGQQSNPELNKQASYNVIPEQNKQRSEHNSLERTKQIASQPSQVKIKQARYKSPEQLEQRADHMSPEKSQHKIQEPLTNRTHGGLSKIKLMSNSQLRQTRARSRTTTGQKKSAIKEESFLAAKEVLDKMIEEVYKPFRIHLTRGVYLDSETKMCVPIEFLPQLAGNVERVEDQLVVSFEGRFLTKDEEVVTLIATMFELPISIFPPIVDMQVTMVGTGVWQTSFQVTNISKKFIKVKIQLPENIRKHFQTRPSNFIVRPNQKEDILIRAQIGWDIYEDSGYMLDKTLSLLDFPISIKVNDLPKQTLGTLAVISHPLALTIEPQSINLGFVNTFETVCEEFWLKNHTIVPLHFAFINIPQCCLVMPMYGFSVIGPAQKIKIQLLYSPGVREAGKAGGQAVHMFSIICTTLERLAAEKSSLQNFNPEEEVAGNSKIVQFKGDNEQVSTLHDLLKLPTEDCISELGELNSKNIETLSFLNENLNAISFLEKKEVIKAMEPTRVSFSKKKMHSEKYFRRDSSFAWEKAKQDMDVITKTISETVNNIDLFISLNCMAIVSDPICELSAQELILPEIPYGSYSVHYIHLRCPNEVSGYSCYCGRFVGLHDDPKQLRITFHFFQNIRNELDIQPITGNINYGEKIKVYFILKPELDTPESPKEAKVKKRKNTVTFKPASTKKSESKLTLKNQEIRTSKLVLQKIKNKPNVDFQTRVRCLISIKGAELSEPRYDELHCDVISKFVRPDIYVATPHTKKEIIFPKTAIGTKRMETIDVYNVSNKLVNVTRSHLSHKDIFICQPLPPSPWSYNEYEGIPLEPDECLKLRLTFTPVEDNYAEEYFELRANDTIIPIKVSGHGVIPRFTFSSQFCVCKLETYSGSKIEDLITISNKCEAELQFEIMKCFQMETTSFDVFKAFLNRHSPAKNIYKEPFLDKTITKDIETNFYESDEPSPISIEPRIFSIPPYKKASIKIAFSPKKTFNVNSVFLRLSTTEDVLTRETTEPPHGTEDEYETKRGTQISPRYSTNRIEEIVPTFYVQKVQVVLGRLTIVAEWIIIGKIAKDFKRRSKLL